ncbi:PAS domain-containing protein, partial [Phlyctochytrium arcticum]
FTSTRQGFHRLISELDDFLHVVSTTGTITLCSSSVRRLLGYQPDELAGRPLADLLHRDDRDNVLNALSRAVSERVEHMHYVRYQRKAGDFVLLHVRAKPLIRNGEVRSVVHTARPVRSKSSQAMDWVLDLRIENIRLRRQLEKALRERGQDPGDHPLLQQVSTKRVMITTDLEANEEEGADPADELSSRIGSAGVDGMSGGLGSEGPGLFENDSVAGIGNSNPAGSTSRGTKRKKSRIPTEELFCRQCGTTQSPEWRKGPAGPKTLCNACGLAYSKKQRKATKTSTAPTGPTAAAKENDP